jgi:hypothetical protein
MHLSTSVALGKMPRNFVMQQPLLVRHLELLGRGKPLPPYPEGSGSLAVQPRCRLGGGAPPPTGRTCRTGTRGPRSCCTSVALSGVMPPPVRHPLRPRAAVVHRRGRSSPTPAAVRLPASWPARTDRPDPSQSDFRGRRKGQSRAVFRRELDANRSRGHYGFLRALCVSLVAGPATKGTKADNHSSRSPEGAARAFMSYLGIKKS